MHQSTDRLVRSILSVLAAALLGAAPADASDFSEPWKRADRALVIDAYEYNPINWQKLASDKRIVGFINKASDGVPPAYRCHGNETEVRLCKALWKRHAVARELFHTRKTVAKALGLKWGAYHLGRPGNPIDQANNFIDFAEPGPDDLIALDIEENDPEKWMSLEDAETFARHIHRRLGRWPVLYTNGTTALHIAENRDRYDLLSRLPLWYARYKPAIGLHFPKGNWQSYTLWQFSAGANCDSRSCPYRAPGTPLDIDVNVASMSAAELRVEWPFGGLVDKAPDTISAVPVPVARRTAIEGGDVSVQYVDVAVEHDDTPAPAEVQAAEPAVAELPDGAPPADEVVELAIESGETVPLPVSRRMALDGGDVTIEFAKVEKVVRAAALKASLGSMAPFQLLLGEQPETMAPVELASYSQAIEKTRIMDLPPAAVKPPENVSTAARDEPSPIVSATRLSREDLPVFLLTKLDGTDETVP